MQVIDIPVAAPGPKEIRYDEEWLAILRETHGIMNLTRSPTRFPTAFADPPAAGAEHRGVVAEALAAAGGPAVPADAFVATVDASKRGQGQMPTSIPRNPQTEAVLRLIGRPWNLGGAEGGAGGAGAGLAAHEPLTGDDFLEDDPAERGQAGAGGMFAPIDIHNMNPHAISDARNRASVDVESGAAAGTAGAGSGGVARDNGGAGAAIQNPEEIDIDVGSSDEG